MVLNGGGGGGVGRFLVIGLNGTVEEQMDGNFFGASGRLSVEMHPSPSLTSWEVGDETSF